jgi:transcriptional regulator with XRE-family HTH domain
MAQEEWFAGRLRELRAAKGWTRQQLADGSGVGLAAIRDIEQGVRVPGWATVIALAEALEVPTDSFKQKPTTEQPEVKPMGRPRKIPPLEEADQPAPKLGRPRKPEAAPAPPAAKPAKKGRGKKEGTP